MPNAVTFQHVTYIYPNTEGQTPAVQDITLTVPQGQRLGILGPNGGGKTTLIRLALGQLKPDSGSVSVLGTTPQAAAHNGSIGYVPQRLDIERGFPLSARQVVELAASWKLPPWKGLPATERTRIDNLITLVGAASFANRPIGSLSGGQTQRIMIARALASQPQLLILDEPTVGIDVAGQLQFAELLTRVHKEFGLTIITVSHDLRAIAAASDQVAVLSRTLHFHASPAGLTPQVLADVFAHDIAGIAGLMPGTPLAGMHVHAHGPTEPCPDHSHAHPGGAGVPPAAGGSAPIKLTIRKEP